MVGKAAAATRFGGGRRWNFVGGRVASLLDKMMKLLGLGLGVLVCGAGIL